MSEVSTTLSHQEARSVYDRMGRWLDTQAFYEDAATGDLVRQARFEAAEAVFEFGCGTGRFAQLLLSQHLPPHARYRAWDVSPKMVGLARARLAAFAGRAEIVLSEGGPPASEPADSCDRFVSNYVLDLLSESDIRAVIGEARRMLRPGGLLCLASLSAPHGPFSGALMAVWSALHARSPALTGGCRPIDLLSFVNDGEWKLRHHGAFTPLGIPSETIVAERA
jgi:ubiquinone/menaquinone biosynthesis C-methylase UbiE